MPFDRIFLDELSARNDIVEIVSQYVQLKKERRELFRSVSLPQREKTGSFSVSPDKQIFHCFGCGAGGGVITFYYEGGRSDLPGCGTLSRRAGGHADTRTGRSRAQSGAP